MSPDTILSGYFGHDPTIELGQRTWSTAVRPVTGDITAQVSFHRDLDPPRPDMCDSLVLRAASRHPHTVQKLKC